MRAWLQYSALAAGVMAMALAGGHLFLDEVGVRSVRLAVAVAFPLQVAAFAVLASRAPESPAFLGAWVSGILVRFLAVGLVAFVAVTRDGLNVLVTLLSLVTLLFVLVLIEPLMLRRRGM